MTFEVNKINKDEVEINIGNIIRECVSKKILILIISSVCAIVIPLLAYVSELKSYQAIINSQGNTEEIELTDSDIIAINTYNLLSKKYDNMSKDKENSIIMNVAYDNLYYGTVVYYFDAHQSIKNAIIQAVNNYIADGELASDLSLLEGFPERKYIQELLGVKVLGEESDSDSDMVMVSIYGSNEQECKKYVEKIDGLISKYLKKIETIIGSADKRIVQETYNSIVSDTLYNRQKNFYTEWKTVKSEFESMKTQLTHNQKVALGMEGEQHTPINVEKPKFSIVYTIVGLFFGLLVSIFGMFLKVVFGGKLQGENEIEKRLGILNYGKMKVLDKNGEIEEGPLSLVVDKILLSVRKENEICFIGTMNEKYQKELDALKLRLKESGVPSFVVENALENPKELAKIENNVKVIWLEGIGKSKVKEIYDLAALCKGAKIDVLGYISVME